jgi:hypothetical protein
VSIIAKPRIKYVILYLIVQNGKVDATGTSSFTMSYHRMKCGSRILAKTVKRKVKSGKRWKGEERRRRDIVIIDESGALALAKKAQILAI